MIALMERKSFTSAWPLKHQKCKKKAHGLLTLFEINLMLNPIPIIWTPFWKSVVTSTAFLRNSAVLKWNTPTVNGRLTYSTGKLLLEESTAVMAENKILVLIHIHSHQWPVKSLWFNGKHTQILTLAEAGREASLNLVRLTWKWPQPVVKLQDKTQKPESSITNNHRRWKKEEEQRRTLQLHFIMKSQGHNLLF